MFPFNGRIPKLVSAKRLAGEPQNRISLRLDFDIAEGLEPVAHNGIAPKPTHHGVARSIESANAFRQIHESSTFGIDWSSRIAEREDVVAQPLVVCKRASMHLGVAAAQIQSIHFGELSRADRRELDQFRPGGLEQP